MTQDELKELLSYDQKTGDFYWLRKMRLGTIKVGSKAGNINPNGYVEIMINKRHYKAHRLAFLYMTGEIPGIVDHKNGIKNDNTWENLRPATIAQNTMNAKKRKNCIGTMKGASFDSVRKCWKAFITSDNKVTYLGSFETEIEAHEAYCKAAERRFGEYARTA